MLKKINIGSFVNKYIVEPAQKLKTSLKIVAVISLTAAALTSCKKDFNSGSDSFGNRSTAAADYPTGVTSLPVVTVPAGNITSSTTWDNDHIWEINGIVTVTGGTLTIEAGTYIKSTVNPTGPNPAANGVLVIAKTGQIHAVGDASNPIVFTSRNLLDGVAGTLPAPGDFGGVIILGNGIVNVLGGDKLIEGLPNDPKYHYGGTTENDNRGEFQFVRIEYAGFALAPDIEVNGLTLGGVGSGTTINHVQTSYGKDDGFEFFGGSVSPSYLVALGSDDDQFDFDNGYNGTINYGLALADGNSSHSGTSPNSDSNGIESDNNAPAEDGTFSLTPRTNPLLNHFSVIGTSTAGGAAGLGYLDGARIRRGSRIRTTNMVLTGFKTAFTFDTGLAQPGDAANSNVSTTSIHGFNFGLVGAPAGAGRITPAISATAANFGMSNPWYAGRPGLDWVTSGTSAGRGADDGVDAWLTLSWIRFDY
jgi:hypothetical protein